jgi:RNase adaptor protein for sRNA GlmZ degradation
VVEHAPPPPNEGPGTELKKLLSKIGITPKAGCKCLARAVEMDIRGCDWCDANVPTIVGWLREEATNRRLPFIDAAGTVLVKRAISNARRLHRGKG